ncbi:unnamed protein product [Rhizophagus irregularis]|nr:unnamed protein product [Rhizophagus irregularis]
MEIQRIRSALGFGTRVGFEDWKSKEFVRFSVGRASEFRRMKKTKICNSFGGLPNSEDRKKTKICSVGFRILKNNEKSRFVSGVSGGIPKNRIPKDSFLSVLERWIYRFGLRFLSVEYTGFGFWLLDVEYIICFDFRFLGFGYIGFDFRLGFGYMGKFSLQIFGWVSLSDFCQIAE